MASIRPFRAVRPALGLAQEIAALPYDVYDTGEARSEISRHPGSFLRIDRAETGLADGIDVQDPAVYDLAASLYQEELASGRLAQDNDDCLYIYRLEAGGRRQTGIVGCVDASEYASGIIRRHENTRPDKVADRVSHIEALGAQTGPVFLAYRDMPAISEIIDRATDAQPLFDFTADDAVRHTGWQVLGSDAMDLVTAFKQVETLYVADGHHRLEAAATVARKRGGSGESGQILGVCFADSELRIYDYNRIVKDLNGLTAEDFLSGLAGVCGVSVIPEANPRPIHHGEVSCYLEGTWYRLRFHDVPADPVESLDVSVLQQRVLGPVLGIADPRTDSRIGFVGGIRGVEELEDLVDSGEYAVAFAMYPTSMDELLKVADAGLLMPPKSTWFEPKLRSGLFIHSI